MKFGMVMNGNDELDALLAELESVETAKSVARTAVSAGLKVLRSAGVHASPGFVKREWGSRLIDSGNGAVGIVGLGVGGYRANVARPHGKYLEVKGPYVGFAKSALQGAMPRAKSAMILAAKWLINKIAKG